MNKSVLCQALIQYRNTPSMRDGLSPAQKLYGHPIQDTLPIHQQAFLPEWQHSREETERRTQQSQEAAAARYNFTANSLPDITVGTNVAVQNARTGSWDTYGLVTSLGPHRHYHVRTARGKTLIRNCLFLCRHVLGSIPTGQRQNESPQPVQRQNEVTEEPQPIQTQQREPQPVQRKSAHQGKPLSRLLEDPSWP